MNNYYTQQQQQFTAFLDELEQLFLKHDIKSVSTYNNCLIFRRPEEADWLFDYWTNTESFVWPSVRKYKKVVQQSDDTLEDDLDEIMSESEEEITEKLKAKCTELIPLTERPKAPDIPGSISLSDRPEIVTPTVEPLADKPILEGTIIVPEATVIRTDPTGTETLSVTTIKAKTQETTHDNKQDTAIVEDWDTAKQEQVEQEINPKINEYINDLADKLYAEAKARDFPKNTLGEYWTHPAVVRAVKQNGFNESAYLIISANTTYWHMLAERMKLVELLDKQQNEPKSTKTAETVEAPLEETEPVAHMETFSTDTIFGTWTVHYSDYKDSVYLDSDKGRTAIGSKVHNWMLIYSRMHPELKNAPTRADIYKTLSENFDKRQNFRYKWYEFVVDVSYSTPIESEDI